ncbi:sensor histidine kinase [Desulfuromonas versatilis]|uniref:histidine kinase n=1 Tax=Desulfuromonas versatilis TaxID=2802975 RepID=A0ABN6DTC8_9BACT|nr:PAS domain-containing sensor histidine kinase [Desulfuromonas versatilis]BCR03276.1 sensor histidine kinase [Desulfuromonas versatilis]
MGALKSQVDFFSHRYITRHLLDAIPSLLTVLNEQLQIVYANRALLVLAGLESEEQLYGKRLGEVLNCLYAAKGSGGCGTTENCAACGAAQAALAGLQGRQGSWECRLTRTVGGKKEAFDLKLQARPMEYREHRFTVVSVSDISHEKRRRALERIFFHDVLNIVTSIKGFAELLVRYDPPDRKEFYSLIHAAAQQVVEEIDAQRLLQAAETDELKPQIETVQLRGFLELQLEIYRHHEAARGRSLVLEPATPALAFASDRTLLGRVLGNMIKNALEGAAEGETVTLGGGVVDSELVFRVHNPGFIPKSVQLQIFHRSFSTKGHGRGLGTYSMRLLSELLGGEVGYSTSEDAGTVFTIRFPFAAVGLECA